MVYKQLTIIFSLLILSFHLTAQKTPEEKTFIISLIDNEYRIPEKPRELNLSEPPYSISLGEEGDPYTVYFSIIAHEDLNDDGIDDYIIVRKSEGMLGGNANTNQMYTYFIMKNNREIDTQHDILTYAPFSYNIIEGINYKNKRLTADITQNYRTYMGENLQSSTVNFVYKNNNLYEESYLTDCKMGQMKDKSIFKTDLPNVKRSLDIDMHNYMEVAHEEYIQGDTIIQASLEGCDNLGLRFDISIKVPEKNFTSQFYKDRTFDIFDILIANTRYKTILGRALIDYKDHAYEANKMVNADIDDTWSYFVSEFNYDKDHNRLNCWISIQNLVNENQVENWDITTRRK